jgi:surface-anchored protein
MPAANGRAERSLDQNPAHGMLLQYSCVSVIGGSLTTKTPKEMLMNKLLQDESCEGSRLACGFVCGIVLAIAVGSAPATARAGAVHGPWTSGHGDLSVVYSGSGSTFGFEVHLHEGATVDGEVLTADEHGEPDEIQIVVPGSANLKRIDNPSGYFEGEPNGYDFTGTEFNATGAAVGGNLWVLGGSADAAHYGTPFVGLSAEEVTGTWNPNSISLTLGTVAFDGSAYGTTGGVFSFYSEELNPMWSSTDGFTQQSVSLTPGSGHTHGFMFFSQPGTYEVTLLASGSNTTEGLVTGSAVYTFQVVPEPSSIALAGLGAAGALAAGWRRRRRAAGENSAFAEAAR